MVMMTPDMNPCCRNLKILYRDCIVAEGQSIAYILYLIILVKKKYWEKIFNCVHFALGLLRNKKYCMYFVSRHFYSDCETSAWEEIDRIMGSLRLSTYGNPRKEKNIKNSVRDLPTMTSKRSA